MPKAGERGQLRLLVAAAPAEMLRSIEQSFEAPAFGSASSRRRASSSSRVFAAAPPARGRGLRPPPPLSGVARLRHRAQRKSVFFRQRPEEEGEQEEDQAQEVRLSLSYYFEKLHGGELSAVFVHDAAPGRELVSASALPVRPTRISGSLFSADRGFDERVAARPELLAAFAAVHGKG